MPFQRSYAPVIKENEGWASSTGHDHEKPRMTAVTSPWQYRLRLIILLVTIGITATAVAMGFVAVNESVQQKNKIVSHFLVVYSVRVTVHNGNIYVPNMITIIGSIGLLGSAIYALGASFHNHRTSHFTTRENLKSAFVTPLYLVILFTVWMLISLIFESIWFHKGKITVTRNDGLSIPPWDVINALVELGIADRFKNVRYWRYALGLQWAAAVVGFVASVLLFCAGIGMQTFTAVMPSRDVEDIEGCNNGQYHYTKRTSATNLDGPVAKQMSARDVAYPETEDEIVIQPRTSIDRIEDQDIALQGPRSPHIITPLMPRSPLVGAHRSPQFSALQTDSEGDIMEVSLDQVAPPVRVESLNKWDARVRSE